MSASRPLRERCVRVLAAALLLSLTACTDDPDPTPPPPAPSPSSSLSVLAPQDGELVVSAAGARLAAVTQLLGACAPGARPDTPSAPAAPAAGSAPPPSSPAGTSGGGGGCSFLPPPAPPLITSAAPTLTLTPARSTALQVTALTPAGEIVPSPVRARELDVAALAPGRYVLTVRGDAGGVWQFTLVRPPR